MTLHVDDFIDDFRSDPYARWMFLHFRMPAEMQMAFRKFMEPHKLFCTYLGHRYRCTGASRMGDVWLAKDFNRDMGYDLRVDLSECSNWGSEP
jgi:hypothetical protein